MYVCVVCEHIEVRGQLWCNPSGADYLEFEDRVFPGLELDK